MIPCSFTSSVRCPDNLLQKIHVRNEPRRRLLFVKTKLGAKVRKNDFSMSRTFPFRCINFPTHIHLDASRSQVPWTSLKLGSYDAFVDPHLKQFFKRAANLAVSLGEKSLNLHFKLSMKMS